MTQEFVLRYILLRMSPDTKIIEPETVLHLGPNLDSDILIPTKPITAVAQEVGKDWKRLIVEVRPGDKSSSVTLYQAVPVVK